MCGAPNTANRKRCYGPPNAKHAPADWEWTQMVPADRAAALEYALAWLVTRGVNNNGGSILGPPGWFAVKTLAGDDPHAKASAEARAAVIELVGLRVRRMVTVDEVLERLRVARRGG